MRRPVPLLLAVLVAALIAGCRVSITEQRAVEIPGNAPIQEKVALAQRVAASVWQSGIRDKIRARFPDVTEEQLRGLDIRWQVIKGVSVNTNGTEPFDNFYLQCTIKLPRSMDSTAAILDYCKELLEAALARTEEAPGAA